MEKIAPKNNSICQELIALSGTFASPEKQGLIIDKLRLWNPGFFSSLARSFADERLCLTQGPEDDPPQADAREAQSEFQKPVK